MIAIHTDSFHWEIDAHGRNKAFVDVRGGQDLLAVPRSPVACIHRNGDTLYPETAVLEDGTLRIVFTDGSRIAWHVEKHASHVVLTLADVEAAPFRRLDFLSVPLTLEPSADPEAFCACAVARNLLTHVDQVPGPQRSLEAVCYPRFGTVGASIAVVGSRFCELRPLLQEIVRSAPDLPHSPLGGPWALDAPENRNSYLFGVPTEETVDDWIGLCQDFGIGQLHFCGGGAFRLGDYDPNPTMFPQGLDSVRTVVDKIHAAGLQAGLHTLSFSIAKNSRYVTPEPDLRLGYDSTFTLAEGLDEQTQRVVVNEPNEHMPRFTNYRQRQSVTLMIDRELIDYGTVEPDSPYAFGQCQRGAYGTTPARHGTGSPVRQLKACWAMFAPDGDSTLFTEIAENIAGLINRAGFDMVYLDGLDGAQILGGDEGRWHYAGRFAFEVFNRLERPIVMEMAAFLHHLWFVRSRMGAWDHAARGHKRFIDLHCRSNANFARIFLPGHLGWWSPRVRGGCKDEATFREDAAYLCTKGIADGIGFSLQGITPERVRSTPHFQALGRVFQRYEGVRHAAVIPQSIRDELGRPGAEFVLDDQVPSQPRFRRLQRTTHNTALPGEGGMRWKVISEVASQAPRLRIEALWSVADYDSEDARTVISFESESEFNDNGPLRCMLNSGKDYEVLPAAPGMTMGVLPAPGRGPGGGQAGRLQARRVASTETVLSSAPDDDLSILDHGERFHRPRRASWARMGVCFDPLLDLSDCQGLGLWVRGDGKGEWLNLQVRSRGRLSGYSDHYIPVTFDGWRYVELVQPESDRFERLSWPYARAVYKLHRHGAEYDSVSAVHLWVNNVPEGEDVDVLLSPVRALPVLENRLRNPALSINGQSIIFPVELGSGCRIEAQGDMGRVLDAKGAELEAFRLPQPIPLLRTGDNDLTFDTQALLPRPHANVTLFAEGTGALMP